MRRIAVFLLSLCLLLAGCAAPAASGQKQYTATFLNLFDTVTTIVGWADSEEAFREMSQAVHDELLYYHELFDIYEEYPDRSNLKTVNDNAGIAPVQVEKAVLELLKDCKRYYELSGGKVNAAMGSVLKLWHDARENGINDPANAAIPDRMALEEAALHTDMDQVILDEAASTVYLADPQMRLDVGAIAKGWATQRVAENAPQGLLISVGGNVCATGPKTADGTPWVIGIQNPAGEGNLHTLYVSGGSVVTSGDYQRTYTVEGKAYHHIIDPATLMPAACWRSVTVVCPDSGLADALSTALFTMTLEEGKALLSNLEAEAFWLDTAGNEYKTPGFEKIMRT